MHYMRNSHYELLIILVLLAYTVTANRNHDSKTLKQQEWSKKGINRKQRNLVTSTTADGTTKVIVQVKDPISFISDNENIKETVKIDLIDSTTIMGLELSDIDAIDSWYNDPNVLSIEPDYHVGIFEDPVTNYESAANNMTTRNLEDYIPYGIDMVLQDRTKFQSLKAEGKVKICVADTGYDINHPDLPKSPDVAGIDRLGERWDYDGNSHGTHVAGTIAALGINGGGVYGVIPSSYNGKFKLLIGKAFDKSGYGTNSRMLDAVQDCVKQGATVISMSLGCNNCYSSAVDYYFESLYDNDILLIAAAGNAGTSEYFYPASYESVISVASISSNKIRSAFSQYNDQVEISAPGESIWSTTPDNSYAMKDGTSMAAPHVAGVAGLLRMFFPKCSALQIRSVLAFTAQDLDASGCNIGTGFGLVQADNAFERLKESNCGSLEGTPRGGCYSVKESDDTGSIDFKPTKKKKKKKKKSKKKKNKISNKKKNKRIKKQNRKRMKNEYTAASPSLKPIYPTRLPSTMKPYLTHAPMTLKSYPTHVRTTVTSVKPTYTSWLIEKNDETK